MNTLKNMILLVAMLLTGLAFTTACGAPPEDAQAGTDDTVEFGTANVPLTVGSSCGDVDAGPCYHLRGWVQVYNAGDTPGVDAPVVAFPTPDGFYEGFPPDFVETTGLPMALDGGDYILTISGGVPCVVGSIPGAPPPEPACYRVWDCSAEGAGTFPAGIGGCAEVQDIATWLTPIPLPFTVVAGDEPLGLELALEFMYTQIIFGYGVVDIEIDVTEFVCEEGEVAAEINNTPAACYAICQGNSDCDEPSELCALGIDEEDLLDPDAIEPGEGLCVTL